MDVTDGLQVVLLFSVLVIRHSMRIQGQGQHYFAVSAHLPCLFVFFHLADDEYLHCDDSILVSRLHPSIRDSKPVSQDLCLCSSTCPVRVPDIVASAPSLAASELIL